MTPSVTESWTLALDAVGSSLAIALVHGEDHRVHFANAAFAALTDTPAAQIVGRALGVCFAPPTAAPLAAMLTRVAQTAVPETTAALSLARGAGMCSVTVYRLHAPRSTEATLLVQCTPLPAEPEALRRAAEMEREVRQANEALLLAGLREQDARREAEAAVRAREVFMATSSHELRSPLASIAIWLHNLREGDADEREAALAALERSARVQHKLIDDLLEISRGLSGKLHVDPTPIDLALAVETTVESCLPEAEARAITLEVAMADEALDVTADLTRLQQAIANLLSNAIKFSPEGGRVELRLVREGDRARITVTDRGKGIAPEFLPHVFEPFRQDGERSAGVSRSGLGLGLAIVRQVIELHGGTVAATSEGLGRGACFTITLPLSAPR